MSYADYAPLVDTGLVLALTFIVWAAYRQLRRRRANENKLTP
jgi:hypothetical protein